MILNQIKAQIRPDQFNQLLQEVNALYQQNRQLIKNQSAFTILDPRHLDNCRLLPDRMALLDRLSECEKVAEIGVADGDFSEAILSRTKVKELHLVDMWGSERYSKGFENCKNKFGQEIENGKVVIHRGLSTDMIPTLEEDYFDWVYIDTNHSYVLTAQELKLVASKVRKDGLICGHDFCTGNVVGGVPYGVIEACHEFAAAENWEYKYLTFESQGHFSFALQRLAGS